MPSRGTRWTRRGRRHASSGECRQFRSRHHAWPAGAACRGSPRSMCSSPRRREADLGRGRANRLKPAANDGTTPCLASLHYQHRSNHRGARMAHTTPSPDDSTPGKPTDHASRSAEHPRSRDADRLQRSRPAHTRAEPQRRQRALLSTAHANDARDRAVTAGAAAVGLRCSLMDIVSPDSVGRRAGLSVVWRWRDARAYRIETPSGTNHRRARGSSRIRPTPPAG